MVLECRGECACRRVALGVEDDESPAVCADHEARVRRDARRELGGEADAAAEVCAEAVDTVRAEDHPHLERAEAAAERDLHVAQVGDCLARHAARLEVFGRDRECGDEPPAVAHPQRRALDVHEPPLVQVGRERVALGDGGERSGALFRECECDAAVCSIDVHPERRVRGGDLCDFREVVDRARARRAVRRDEHERHEAACMVLGERARECVPPEAVVVLRAHVKRAEAQAEHHRGLGRERVRLCRAVHDEARSRGGAPCGCVGVGVASAHAAEGGLTCGNCGGQARLACACGNDAAALVRRVVREEAVAEREHAHEPVEDDKLELGSCWRRGPVEARIRRRDRVHVREDAFVRRVRREERHERRVLPVRRAAQDMRVIVGLDGRPRLAD